MSCQHENFNAVVDVNRIVPYEDGDVIVYHADIKISCRDCGQALEFVGLPNGISFYRPTVSLDGQELRAPMVIPGAEVPPGMAGFSVSQCDAGGNRGPTQ